MTKTRSLIHDTCGATAIEYAFIVCLIAVAALGSMGLAGNAVGNTLNVATTQINTAPAMNPKG
jgi:Flp pilus assembly pilin Flp